jgi:hypothetical protein
MTPLILATKKKSEQLLNALMHAGADVDAKSKDVQFTIALRLIFYTASNYTLI